MRQTMSRASGEEEVVDDDGLAAMAKGVAMKV